MFLLVSTLLFSDIMTANTTISAVNLRPHDLLDSMASDASSRKLLSTLA